MKQTINGWTKSSMIQHIKANFKGKSTDDSETCLYRGPNDTKCAVGMFIPDNSYKTEMDYGSTKAGPGASCVSYSKMVAIYPEIVPFMPLDDLGMFLLQIVHDCSHPHKTLSDMLEWIDTHVE